MPLVIRSLEKMECAHRLLDGKIMESRFPGIVAGFRLYNAQEISNWYIFWADKADAYMRRNGHATRKNWHTNVMKDVLEKYSDLSKNDKVLFIATNRTAYMDLLGAARDCEDISTRLSLLLWSLVFSA